MTWRPHSDLIVLALRPVVAETVLPMSDDAAAAIALARAPGSGRRLMGSGSQSVGVLPLPVSLRASVPCTRVYSLSAASSWPLRA